MKKKISFPFLHIFFFLTLLLGLLLVLASLLSFDVTASILNRFTSDGKFESFTPERFQSIRTLLGSVGGCLVVLSGLLFVQRRKIQEIVDRFFTQVRDLSTSFRQDAQVFWKDVRDAFTRLRLADIAVLAGLILAAIVTRLYQLNAQLLADEAYTYNAFASRSLWQTISDYHLPNNHVFLSIMVNILTHLFGNQVWLIRLPTMVAGVLMVPAGYVLGQRLYGRNTATLGAAFIAVFPILVMYSVWARGYGIVALMTLLTMILGDYVRKNRNRFAWTMLVIFSALGFYTVPIMLFPFGALFLWLFLSRILGDPTPYRSRLDFIKHWLVGGFASAFLTVLFYAPILIMDSDRFFHNQFVAPVGWDVLPGFVWDGLRTMWLDWTSIIPGWIVVIGVAGLIASLVLHKKISDQRISLQIAFLAWIVALIIVRRPDMNARLWLFLAAPVLIWSAGGIVGMLELISDVLWKKFLVQGFVGVIVVSVILGSLMLIPKIPDRWSQKSSIETTVLYLKDHLQEGDLVNASTNSLSIIRYYFGLYDIPLDHVRRSGKFQRAFLVVSRESDSLETLSPVDDSNRPLINLDTARIILQFDGLTVYECYRVP